MVIFAVLEILLLLGLPPLSSLEKDENGVEMLKKTIFAFDFMSLSFPSLLWAPLYVPALVAAFPPKEAGSVEEEEEDEGSGALHGVSATDCACEVVVVAAASTEKKKRKVATIPTSKKQKLSNSIEVKDEKKES